jgi:hypothetical protein
VKKRRPDLSLSNIESDRELRSIFAALEGSPQQLSARLRTGMASKVEQALAADLIEGKIKPRRSRLGSDRESRLLVAVFIRLLERLWTVPNMEKAYLAALGIVPTLRDDPHIELKGLKLRNPQRKAILHLARKIVGKGSKEMSERQVYNALTEFDDAAIAQLRKPLMQMLLKDNDSTDLDV